MPRRRSDEKIDMPVVGNAAGGRPTGRRQIRVLLQCPAGRRIWPSNNHVVAKRGAKGGEYGQLRNDERAGDISETSGSSPAIFHRGELGAIR